MNMSVTPIVTNQVIQVYTHVRSLGHRSSQPCRNMCEISLGMSNCCGKVKGTLMYGDSWLLIAIDAVANPTLNSQLLAESDTLYFTTGT